MDDVTIKILLLGDEKVGKTTFLSCVEIIISTSFVFLLMRNTGGLVEVAAVLKVMPLLLYYEI